MCGPDNEEGDGPVAIITDYGMESPSKLNVFI